LLLFFLKKEFDQKHNIFHCSLLISIGLFFCIVTKNLQSTATMAINTKEEVEILGGKATIYTNDF
jgi:hypothetical protein